MSLSQPHRASDCGSRELGWNFGTGADFVGADEVEEHDMYLGERNDASAQSLVT